MTYRIASIPGDGIGVDVVAEARTVLDRAGELYGFDFDWNEVDWSCERFLKTGAIDAGRRPRPTARATTRSSLARSAFPGVPDHVSLWAC